MDKLRAKFGNASVEVGYTFGQGKRDHLTQITTRVTA